MRRHCLAARVFPLLTAVALFANTACDRALAADETEKSAQNAVSKTEERRKKLAEEKALLRLFADTLEQVKSKYVEADVSERELIEAAIRGMISELDPYSNYIPPEELEQFRRGVEREYAGIGIHVADREGNLQIISPIFGTPAWRAGLRAGDHILKIGDKSTRGLPIDESIKLMTGKVGSAVTISVLHPDEKTAETVTLKREIIRIPTVLGYRRTSNGEWGYFCKPDEMIGYIRLTHFARNTAGDLANVLKRLTSKGMKALVLDLRFNPGGMLPEAIQVCDLFVREGKIVSTEGRGAPNKSWNARDKGTVVPKRLPVAVLVNRFSASAAEIVSACLQDHGVAVVVGERTWGKGSVQNIILFEHDNSALKLTTAGYMRPSGKNIHRSPGALDDEDWGVQPDDGYAIRCTRAELNALVVHFSELDTMPRQHNREDGDGDQKTDGETDGKNGQDEPKSSQLNEKPAFVDRQFEKALKYLQGRLAPTPSKDVNPRQHPAEKETPNLDELEKPPRKLKSFVQ